MKPPHFLPNRPAFADGHIILYGLELSTNTNTMCLFADCHDHHGNVGTPPGRSEIWKSMNFGNLEVHEFGKEPPISAQSHKKHVTPKPKPAAVEGTLWLPLIILIIV